MRNSRDRSYFCAVALSRETSPPSMNPTNERFFTAQAETSSGAGCGSRAIGGIVIVEQSRNAKRACIWLRVRFFGGCACRQLNPGILVVQSAQGWATKNVPGAIDGARHRCIDG